MKRSHLLLALALTLLASPLAAQGDQQVRSQITLAAAALDGEGYRSTHTVATGWLRDGYYRDLTVTLRQGVEYAIVGSCDEDCDDLDLKLYDENWNLIDEDTGSDDHPVVEVTPNWTGTFHVRVLMEDCTASTCKYGVGVFGR
jgi:hypothetical protein